MLGNTLQISGDLWGDEKGKARVRGAVDVVNEVINCFANVCKRIFFRYEFFIVMMGKQARRGAGAIKDQDGLAVLKRKGDFVSHRYAGKRRFRNHKVAALDPAFEFFVKFEPLFAGLEAHLIFRDIEDMVRNYGKLLAFQIINNRRVVGLIILLADQRSGKVDVHGAKY